MAPHLGAAGLVRLGSNVDRFHFLGPHDPANLYHKSVRAPGRARSPDRYLFDWLRLRFHRRSHLEQIASDNMKKLTINNILVPIDFSELSIRAISIAKSLGQRLGSTIHLASVQELTYPVMFYGATVSVPVSFAETLEVAREGAAMRLKALAKEYGLTGTTESVIGAPIFNEICSMARRVSADLVVTPTHGRTGLHHLFLGSTAERLVQHSPCPVFVFREGKKSRARVRSGEGGVRIDTILVPIDFSRCSLGGLRDAIQFAGKFAARIIVLHAVEVGPLLGADGYGAYEISRYGELAKAAAEKRMPAFLQNVKFGGVDFETQVVIGRPVDAICFAAQEKGADLIVTATHGRTGLSHILIGSTAEVVVRHAPCPVLVVPSHPVERRKRLQSILKRTEPSRFRRLVTPAMKQKPLESDRFTKRSRKLAAQPFPERRKTNKFRESHAGSTR